jgi:acid phosphatase family membrane protein YuiD
VVGMQLQLRADDPAAMGSLPGPDLLLFLASEAIYESPHQFATAVLRCVSSAFTAASARHKAGRQAAVVDSLLYVWREHPLNYTKLRNPRLKTRTMRGYSQRTQGV